MTHIIDRLLGIERLIVSERERVLVLNKGRLHAILGPGEHRLKTADTLRETHILGRHVFISLYSDALWRERPDLAETHLERLEAGLDEVVLILRDGRPERVLAPEDQVTVWKDAGPWSIERLTLDDTLILPRALARRLTSVTVNAPVETVEVPEGYVGLLSVDGKSQGRLDVGRHTLWRLEGRKVAVQLVETRWRLHEVTGQEILTRDRVTLRVNISAKYRVVDPERAVGSVRDYGEALHRALQLAFRKTLGALTLDRLLEDKVSVDVEAAETVRVEMAAIGIELGDIALKDVILPGEMREILNTVVAAAKEAEANVIRRREETNATRSLLNTAKVMADNPVMLRLKELEALEGIAGKIGSLTVHNGTNGLMSDIVRLHE